MSAWEDIDERLRQLAERVNRMARTPTGGSGGGGASLSDDDPIIAGTAAPGSSGEASRSDHVHPTDTTRAASTDARFPTSDEKAALAGTGTPNAGNPYVTDDDSRMTNARTPTSHAAGHIGGGGDEIDGDKLDIDYTPANYTPDASPAEAADVDSLAAHLKGISDALDGVTYSGHTHDLADITDAGTAAAVDVPASGDAAADEAVLGDDTRLTDARTPTSHTHDLADITDAGTMAAEAAADYVAKAGATMTGSLTLSAGNIDVANGAIQGGNAVATAWSGSASYAFFGHESFDTASGYALLHSNTGDTYLNAETGRTMYLRIGNASKLRVNTSGLLAYVPLDMNGQDITNPGNIDAKGDLMAGTAANTWDRLPVGTNGHVLTANSSESTGLEWVAPGAPSAHASTHIQGGSDEIDGDKLDVDWTPSNSTPDTTPSEVTSAAHLAAILAGLDNALTIPTILQYTSGGSFTKASYPDARYVIAICQAGGGGGGGRGGTYGNGSAEGGGGGGCAVKVVPFSSLAASETITIGGGGSGGAAGDNNGSAGGSTSFGTHCVATGGAGGTYNGFYGAAGGSSSAADMTFPGGEGGGGSGTVGSWAYAPWGYGGGSTFGDGGTRAAAGTGGQNGTGAGGGGGGANKNGGTNRPGGDGADGLAYLIVI